MFEHKSTIGKNLDKGITSILKTKPGEIPYPDSSQEWEMIAVIPTPKKDLLQYFWKRKI